MALPKWTYKSQRVVAPDFSSSTEMIGGLGKTVSGIAEKAEAEKKQALLDAQNAEDRKYLLQERAYKDEERTRAEKQRLATKAFNEAESAGAQILPGSLNVTEEQSKGLSLGLTPGTAEDYDTWKFGNDGSKVYSKYTDPTDAAKKMENQSKFGVDIVNNAPMENRVQQLQRVKRELVLGGHEVPAELNTTLSQARVLQREAEKDKKDYYDKQILSLQKDLSSSRSKANTALDKIQKGGSTGTKTTAATKTSLIKGVSDMLDEVKDLDSDVKNKYKKTVMKMINESSDPVATMNALRESTYIDDTSAMNIFSKDQAKISPSKFKSLMSLAGSTGTNTYVPTNSYDYEVARAAGIEEQIKGLQGKRGLLSLSPEERQKMEAEQAVSKAYGKFFAPGTAPIVESTTKPEVKGKATVNSPEAVKQVDSKDKAIMQDGQTEYDDQVHGEGTQENVPTTDLHGLKKWNDADYEANAFEVAIDAGVDADSVGNEAAAEAIRRKYPVGTRTNDINAALSFYEGKVGGLDGAKSHAQYVGASLIKGVADTASFLSGAAEAVVGSGSIAPEMRSDYFKTIDRFSEWADKNKDVSIEALKKSSPFTPQEVKWIGDTYEVAGTYMTGTGILSPIKTVKDVASGTAAVAKGLGKGAGKVITAPVKAKKGLSNLLTKARNAPKTGSNSVVAKGSPQTVSGGSKINILNDMFGKRIQQIVSNPLTTKGREELLDIARKAPHLRADIVRFLQKQ